MVSPPEAANDTKYWITVAPVINFTTSVNFLVFPNGVELRELAAQERKKFNRMLGSLLTISSGIDEAKYCLALADDEDAALRHFAEVITAFRLIKSGGVSYRFHGTWRARSTSGQDSATTVSWSSGSEASGNAYELTESDASAAADVTSALDEVKDTKLLQRAIDRFNFGYDRKRADDKLVDYWMALETLFLGQEEQSELSFKAALRIARYTGATSSDRLAIFAEMKKAYGTRSRIVHGNSVPTDITEITAYTEETLRKSLRKSALDRKPPDLASLDREAAAGEASDGVP